METCLPMCVYVCMYALVSVQRCKKLVQEAHKHEIDSIWDIVSIHALYIYNFVCMCINMYDFSNLWAETDFEMFTRMRHSLWWTTENQNRYYDSLDLLDR